jgi:hypothetical protein
MAAASTPRLFLEMVTGKESKLSHTTIHNPLVLGGANNQHNRKQHEAKPA